MNRRLFVQRALMLTGALSFNYKKIFAKNSGKVVTGRVTAVGKPLAGVLVTDGFSILKTGKDGMYNFTPDAKAEFIHISLPAGYEFPHENQIARFYRHIAAGSDLNFDLIPLKKDDHKHKFVLWADPQVKNEKDVAKMMAQSVPDTKALIASLGVDSLVHGITVGDLVWDNHALFPEYNKAIAQIGIPFFQGIGNHDMDYRLGGDETSDQTFKKYYGPTYYSFNRGRAHYVMLDDVRYLGPEREYDGYITEQQLKWLVKDLSYLNKNDLLFICLHIPVHSGVKNRQDLYDILKPYKNVHILSGHTHYNLNRINDNVYEHNHGTVCGAWWTGPICEDGTPRGYGVYEVDGNQVKWYYKSIDTDKSNQLSVYTDEQPGSTNMVANVYNWDPEWKVEYWFDGQYQGKLQNKRGFDPLSVKLYKGDKLPAGRTFAEPKNTDHLFTASLSTNTKKIKVVATDRFGDKYEKEINI